MFRILFPTDFSETCDHALSYLLRLLEDVDTRIDLLHVYDSNALVTQNLHLRRPFSILDHLSNLEDKLQQLAERIPHSLRGSSLLENARYPSIEIVRRSEELGSSLICMGLRQKYSMTDRLLGTITGRTLESAQCPVLAVPNGASKMPPQQLLLVSNQMEHPVGDQITLAGRDLLMNLHIIAPRLHLYRLGDSRSEEAFQPIHEILETETIDAILLPSTEKELLRDLYYSAVPRIILFRARLPLFLL